MQAAEPTGKTTRTRRTEPRRATHSQRPSVEQIDGTPWPRDFGNSANRLIGRTHEARLIRELIVQRRHRIITVTGEPGVGKTRLALEVAASLAAAGGELALCWVPLESIPSHDLVLPALMRQLRIRKSEADHLNTLVDSIADRRLLLVLDNFEHLLRAREQIATLVARCPRLTVLVTSRMRLQLNAEHVVVLDPLDGLNAGRADAATHGDAVQLFLDRAAVALPGFHVERDSELAAIVEICRRVDGIPLAIELAASRLRVLRTPAALLARMDWGGLPLLVGGPVDAPGRHASMQATIDWSYNLLAEPERALLRHLSVFDGSFTAVAAAYVSGDTAELAADDVGALQILLDSGLIQPQLSRSSEPRFCLRGVIREYARYQLASIGELESVERRYVNWFVDLGETAEDELRGPRQVAWLNRLGEDLANIRGVLRWADENEEVEVGARLASALGMLWVLRAPPGEGRAWLSSFLSSEQPLPTAIQVRLLTTSGATACFEGDYTAAWDLLEHAQALASRHRHTDGVGWTHLGLGDAARHLDTLDVAADAYQRSLLLFSESGGLAGAGWSRLGLAHLARLRRSPLSTWASLYAEAVETWRRVGDRWGMATALRFAAYAAYMRGDFARAADLYDECLPYFRELDFAAGTGWALNGMGDLERARNRYLAAEPLFNEAIRLFREAREERGLARANRGLAHVLLNQVELAPAVVLLRESMASCADRADTEGLLACIAGCARVALALGDASAASQLLGASRALVTPQEPADGMEIQRTRDAARHHLGDERFKLGAEAGMEMSSATAAALCRAILDAATDGTPALAAFAPSEVMGLTPREYEVVVLIARGLKDREIAATLVMGRSTASWHVRNVLGKLRLSRAQIGVWALEKGLLKSTY